MTDDLTKWATWREIHAQPDIWGAFWPLLEPEIAELRDWIAASGADEIWFSGAGTSAYIGDFVAAALAVVSSLPLKSVASTDLVAAPHQFLGKAKPLVVSFGRSGDSAESIGVLSVMDRLAPDAPRLNITCNAKGALAIRKGRNQRTIVLPDTTHDSGFAMTSSYSTMLLTALAIFDPNTRENAFSVVAQAVRDRLPDLVALAQDMAIPKRMVVTGSGALRFAAREAALKIMELTAGEIPVLWDSALGFRHGPKSFVADQTHILVFVSADPDIARYDTDLAAELRAQFRGITVTEIAAGPISDAWGGVVQVIAAQVIAAVLSGRMGYNVDDPFAGRGTLTRVVSGVKLYPPAVL